MIHHPDRRATVPNQTSLTNSVGGRALTVPRHGGVPVGPDQLHQAFNDANAGGTGFFARRKAKPDLSLIYPVDPKQLPKELAGGDWPPKFE